MAGCENRVMVEKGEHIAKQKESFLFSIQLLPGACMTRLFFLLCTFGKADSRTMCGTGSLLVEEAAEAAHTKNTSR